MLSPRRFLTRKAYKSPKAMGDARERDVNAHINPTLTKLRRRTCRHGDLTEQARAQAKIKT
jgi:hypothetical protein